MLRAPPAWPHAGGAGGASAPTSRSPSEPPSRVGARPQRARVRSPSRPPLSGLTTGHRRTEASQAARATAPEAQGAARSVRCRCADASHPGPRGHARCSGPAGDQSSVARSSSPRPHPRWCGPALTARSPERAASRSDPGPTGASLPDPLRSDDQQPAPWLASATPGAPAYPLLNNPGILNPSPSPGPRMRFSVAAQPCHLHRVAMPGTSKVVDPNEASMLAISLEAGPASLPHRNLDKAGRSVHAVLTAAPAATLRGPALAQLSAPAQISSAGQQAPGFYRYKVGDVEVTAIHDGFAPRPLDGRVRNADINEVKQAM